MKPQDFDYHRPDTLDDALASIRDAGSDGRIIAGGQSLVPMLNLRLASATRLVDISRIASLREVHETAGAVTYGACIRHAAFEDGDVPDATNGLMRRVAHGIAYRAIRNRGTIGGSAALADPSADWLPLLAALGARFTIAGSTGARACNAEQMFLGPYTTALAEDEILVSITVPRLSANARWGYEKIVRKAGEYPLAIACMVSDETNAVCRVALAAANRDLLVLQHTSDWLKQPVGTPRDAFFADMENAARTGEPYELKLCETVVSRAAARMVAS